MSQRFEMRLVSKFKEGITRVKKLDNGSWKEVSPESANSWNSNGTFPAYWQLWRRVIINSPDETMSIVPPNDMDIRRCCIRFWSTENVKVECSVEKNQWNIVFPNSDTPDSESPVTVNVDISDEEPDDLEPEEN